MEEEIGDLARQDRLDPKGAQHLIKGDRTLRQQAMTCRNLLCEEFSELPQLDQGRGSVIEEITLSQCAEPRKTLVLHGEKIEIAGSPHRGSMNSSKITRNPWSHS